MVAGRDKSQGYDPWEEELIRNPCGTVGIRQCGSQIQLSSDNKQKDNNGDDNENSNDIANDSNSDNRSSNSDSDAMSM